MRRADTVPEHRNNFDFLRLLFAILVMVTHALVLSGGGEADSLMKVTGGQLSWSYLGVRGFFVISGFLVFQSLRRSSSVYSYGSKRALRILPGLLTVLLVSALLLGPLLSVFSLKNYFGTAAVLQYILSSLRVFPVPRVDCLPGLFADNPFGCAVNGSLWTVWFELFFYLLLLLFWPARKRSKLLRICLPVLAVFSACASILLPDNYHAPLLSSLPAAGLLFDLAAYFFGGAAMALWSWQQIRYRPLWLLLVLLFAAAAIASGVFYQCRYLAIPLLVVLSGTGHARQLRLPGWVGEPSYGIYIYAFPAQQALVQAFHLSSMALLLASVPVVVALGIASWHWVEAPFIRRVRRSAPGV